MATYIPNTNIPLSVLDGLKADDPGKWRRILDRLNSEIQNGDSKAINDALFDVAFYTQMGDGTGKPGNVEYGRGQGNSNVSKIHDGSWTINSNVEPVNFKTWAETYINSPTDVYIQDNNDVVSMDPNTGKVLVNQRDSDGNLGAAPVNAVVSGDKSKLDSDMTTWIGIDTTDTTDTTRGAQGSIDLLSYRPQTKNYWDQYIPKASQGLLGMDPSKMQPEYSLAYQPGEFRDPNTWAQWADDHKGHIPEGAWRRATVKPVGYLDGNVPRQDLWARTTGDAYKYLNAPDWQTAGQAANPWEFTSPAMGTNIAWQPWTAKSMNLTPAMGTEWKGLLGGLANTPAVDTSTKTLLGV